MCIRDRPIVIAVEQWSAGMMGRVAKIVNETLGYGAVYLGDCAEVAVLPLVDWSRQVGSGATSLSVTVDTNQLPAIRSFSRESMATGSPVVVTTDATGRTVFHVPRLTVADAIVLRPNNSKPDTNEELHRPPPRYM